jgi:hypothetical protein
MKTSLKRALRVLGLVKLDALSKEARSNILVECYENCREQGFAVVVMGLKDSTKLVFAENRNSDCMVLYVGSRKEFNTGNIPSETVYQAARYFSAERGIQAGERACAREVQKLVVEAANKAVEEFEEAAAARKAKEALEAQKKDHDSDYYTKPVTPGGHTQWHMENDITHS